MHIEPGIVDGAKIALSYATGAGVLAYASKTAVDAAKASGVVKLGLHTAASTTLVFSFFQLLPHFPVGVSEVHFILGSTLLLMFGAAPAAFGLTLGLLAQGLLFAPFDLPLFGINVTTLLVPLFAISALANRIIPANTAYKDVTYAQALKLSATFQAGIVGWVAFWAFYGQGFGAETLASVGTFGAAYMSVVIIEPIADLAVLALAKHMPEGLFQSRMYKDAA